MSIDQLTENPINIKELTVPEPGKKKELLFDPVKEVAGEIWEQAKSELQKEWSASRDIIFGELASSMLILFPERRQEVLTGEMGPLYEAPMIISATNLKIMYPSEPLDGRHIENDRLPFESIKAVAEENKDNVLYWSGNSGIQLWDAFVLYPDKFQELRSIDGLAETMNKAAESEKQEPYWNDFLDFKLMAKLLGKDTRVTDEEWDSVKGYFHLNPSVEVKIQMAARAKLLLAKDIRMTPEGIQVTPPDVKENLSNDLGPVPERRRF